MKSKTYTQSKQPSDKMWSSKFCLLDVKRIRFQNRKEKRKWFFDHSTTITWVRLFKTPTTFWFAAILTWSTGAKNNPRLLAQCLWPVQATQPFKPYFLWKNNLWIINFACLFFFYFAPGHPRKFLNFAIVIDDGTHRRK